MISRAASSFLPLDPRGAVLFEMLLSIALFVGAASFTLGAMRSTLTALDRRVRQAFAMGLARSKMAELEAGLITINDLREDADGMDSIGSFRDRSDDARLSPWRLEVQAGPSEHRGLRLVTITVRDGDSDLESDVATATLRQLVPLHNEEEEWYEEDDLFLGLPPGGEAAEIES